MGTHISRVKSIDLDMWDETQMAVRECNFIHLLVPILCALVHPEVGEPSREPLLGGTSQTWTPTARPVSHRLR